MILRRRAWMVALALVAALFVGARSLCDTGSAGGGALHAAMAGTFGHLALGHAAQDGGSAPDCCASVESSAQAMASEPWLQASGSGKLAALLAVFVLGAASLAPPAAATRYRSLPRSLSFHTRSARILR